MKLTFSQLTIHQHICSQTIVMHAKKCFTSNVWNKWHFIFAEKNIKLKIPLIFSIFQFAIENMLTQFTFKKSYVSADYD